MGGMRDVKNNSQAMEKTAFGPRAVSKGPSQADPFSTADETHAAWRPSTERIVVAASKVVLFERNCAAPMYADMPVVSRAPEVATKVWGSGIELRNEGMAE